jgi:hypothetical protein
MGRPCRRDDTLRSQQCHGYNAATERIQERYGSHIRNNTDIGPTSPEIGGQQGGTSLTTSLLHEKYP